MGSISGWLGVGAGGPYSASKFALQGNNLPSPTSHSRERIAYLYLGAAECLAQETVHVGIRTHVLVLGQFRTNILDFSRKEGVLEPTSLSDYDCVKREMFDRHSETHGRQPGDPKLAVQRILDIARMENLTEEERTSLPLYIPLGTDALSVLQMKCTQTLESLKAWEKFAKSTDFAGESAVPSYIR